MKESECKALEANIWKYGFKLVSNKRVFVAILGVFYLTVPDVTAQTIGMILLVGNFAGFIFEVPSGYISDKMGHKHALVLSNIFMIIANMFLLFADNVWLLYASAICISAGFAFHSGTGSAFLHETLRALGRDNEYAKISGKLQSLGFAIPIALQAMVPFLVALSYRWPFAIALVIDVIALLVVLSLKMPPVTPQHVEEIRATTFWQVMREGARLKFFPLAVFSGIASGLLIGVSSFRAPYQELVGLSVVYFGLLFGIGRLGASMMLAKSDWIRERFSFLSFYGWSTAITFFLVLALGMFSQAWIVAGVFLLLNAFQWGLSQVDESYHLDLIRTSRFKATLLSLNAQVDNIVAGISGFLVGFAIARIGYAPTFLWISGIFLVITVSFLIFLSRYYREEFGKKSTSKDAVSVTA